MTVFFCSPNVPSDVPPDAFGIPGARIRNPVRFRLPVVRPHFAETVPIQAESMLQPARDSKNDLCQPSCRAFRWLGTPECYTL